MASTSHRKDMTSNDFLLLANFSRLFLKIGKDGVRVDFGLICLLGEISMLLPVWCQSGGAWRFDIFKSFNRDAVGIETKALRNMCRYLGISEAKLITTLFRYSMLAVVPRQKNYKPFMYRMPFTGEIKGCEGYAPPGVGFGFIIERRRLEGLFRTEQDSRRIS